ncbi:MAG: hypothetical protein GC155_00840 [Alphaproteobacteria bacterium]|nr:hypothetical protein [Alphaproteobacteria bacterium]
MTSAHSTAHWPGNPAPTQLWQGALLRLIAMLASALATIVRMPLTRLPRECHTDVTPERLPAQDCDSLEKNTAATNGPNCSPRIRASLIRHPAPAREDAAPASPIAMARWRTPDPLAPD